MYVNKLITAAFVSLSIATVAPIALAQSALVNGEVTRVDESAGKITIKHGPMPKFDLEEGHRMVFRASDPAMLKAVKAGDKVRFEADKVNGQFTILKIEKAPG